MAIVPIPKPIALVLNYPSNPTAYTATLDWYKELAKWHEIIHSVELYGGILDIEDDGYGAEQAAQ